MYPFLEIGQTGRKSRLVKGLATTKSDECGGRGDRRGLREEDEEGCHLS